MALLNSHPDYLREPAVYEIYSNFLSVMKERKNYWHTLPRDVARWWRERAGSENWDERNYSTVFVENGELKIVPCFESRTFET